MKTRFIKAILILIFLPFIAVFGQLEKDTIRYNISLKYLFDLSDTYGGGEMFAGEFGLSKSWYGARFGYGHFLSQSDFIFTIPLEESGYILEIPFEEMAIMKMGTLSVTFLPIQGRKFFTELIFGAAYARAKWSGYKSLEYTFDTIEGKFTSLYRDYQLVTETYFGYQAGITISYYPLKKAGLELDVRIQDFNNKASFFFIGGGFCFKL